MTALRPKYPKAVTESLIKGDMAMDKRQQIIEVVAYNPDWPHRYEADAKYLQTIFGDLIEAIYHIGSTAVPGIKAKPTIDMLMLVKNIQQVDPYNDDMASIGYEAWGEYGIAGRRFFVKGEQKRTHHLHAFQTDSGQCLRHLALRD